MDVSFAIGDSILLSPISEKSLLFLGQEGGKRKFKQENSGIAPDCFLKNCLKEEGSERRGFELREGRWERNNPWPTKPGKRKEKLHFSWVKNSTENPENNARKSQSCFLLDCSMPDLSLPQDTQRV